MVIHKVRMATIYIAIRSQSICGFIHTYIVEHLFTDSWAK